MQVLKLIILIAVSIIFIIFGFQLLINAYDLDDPFSFVITFFAANLMILISASLALGFFIKLYRHLRAQNHQKQE